MSLFLALALQASLVAPEVSRIPAADADQGVVAGVRDLYAIDNNVIARIDRRTGKTVARWEGSKTHYPHINSCILKGRLLVCAASNYPSVPQASSIETFDARTLKPVASRSLGPGRGSLTWLDWHQGSWWACFAHYGKRGGEPGRDSRYTTLVRFDGNFVEQGAWLFPDSVIGRMAPYSASGGRWNRDGYLYVSGHDLPEIYAMKLPPAGTVLEHVATIAVPTQGQAIDWDPVDGRLLWSIERKQGFLVSSRVPPIVPPAAK